MSKRKEEWNTKENAEVYDKYTKDFSMYSDTSKDLVSFAEIRPGMTVVDLAAGTGATTQAILDVVGGEVNVILADQAGEMLNVAKTKFTGPNFQFAVSEAEELRSVTKEKVDAVICNSAFWQMDTPKTLQSVTGILKPGGVFAFNLPDQVFSHPDFHKQPRHPFPYSEEELITLAKENGLVLEKSEIQTYQKTTEEMLAFADIPVMKGNFKTKEDRNRYLEELKAGAPQDISRYIQRITFVFKKS